jgi:uncharacterized protein (DUF2384 family)
MATAAQRAMFLEALPLETNDSAVPTGATIPSMDLSQQAAVDDLQYQSFKSLVDRAVEVFGDKLTASRWLSMPSSDFDGKVPIQIAQSLEYDPDKMRSVFEPIFLQIEHGIYG